MQSSSATFQTRNIWSRASRLLFPAGVTVDSDTGRIIYPENFVWNGTFAAATWTACPAWILYNLLTNTRYGFGNHVDTAQIDKYAFFAASKYANALVDDGLMVRRRDSAATPRFKQQRKPSRS